MKTIIQTDKAPAPIGPYSQAILINDTLYTSGQIAFNPETGPRHLQGCYVDNDAVLSKRRVLRGLN